jgi:hypothetical protein
MGVEMVITVTPLVKSRSILIVSENDVMGNWEDVLQLFVDKMSRIYIYPKSQGMLNTRWICQFKHNHYVFSNREEVMSFLDEINHAIEIVLGTTVKLKLMN